MAFESLTDRLNGVFKKLRGKGKLTEADIKAAMREVRMALLEADVNYKVAKDFCAQVSERAMGQEVMESLTPAQQVVKIVNEELTKLMGGDEPQYLRIKNKGQTVLMMCGLQGNGKTTHAAKLGRYYRSQGRRPLLVACDVYRPAAIEQLKIVGEQVNVPVFSMGTEKPELIAEKAMAYARDHGNDIVILDTAGRLQIDDALMDELRPHQAACRQSTKRCWSWMPCPARRPSMWPRPSTRRSASTGVILTKTGRRHPRRCSAFRPGCHRQAHLVPGHRRKAGGPRAVLSVPHVQPNPGHGRCALPD